MEDEYLSVQEAAEDLGVSRFTVWRLIRDGELTAYQSSVDRRRKLVRRVEIDALKRPKAIQAKMAA